MARDRATKAELATLAKVFNLKTYDVCSTWSLADWSDALNSRLGARFAEYIKTPSATIDGHDKQRFQQAALNFFAHPSAGDTGSMPTALRDQFALEFFEGAYVQGDGYVDWRTQLQPICEGEDTGWNPDGMTDLTILENELFCSTYPAWKMHRKLDPRSSLGRSQLMLYVDLNFSNEFLIREFEQWLIRSKKRMAPKRTHDFPKIDTAHWHKYRYLALLDLKFWSAVHGIPLSNSQLADCLAPMVPKASEGNIRKTAFPNALMLLDPYFIIHLQYEGGYMTNLQRFAEEYHDANPGN